MGRLSQDNEFGHWLILAVEKIREDKIPESGFWYGFMPKILALSYAAFARTLALVCRKLAFHFNAMFEDHAEHEYARFVEDHPELDQQPVTSAWIQAFGNPATWGDVFRHIGLDERIDRNESLAECGRKDQVVPYLNAAPQSAPVEA